MEQKIRNKIENNIELESLKIINNSYLHSGHREASGDDSHFELIIKSKYLKSMSLVNSHRLVKSILKEEFLLGLHSVSIKIL
jgi:stress-induced morphogen